MEKLVKSLEIGDMLQIQNGVMRVTLKAASGPRDIIFLSQEMYYKYLYKLL